MPMKYNVIEGLCSLFVVGLGQIIKGDNHKGLKMLLAFYFLLPMIVYVSLLFSSPYMLYAFGGAIICAPVLWIYNIGDALLR